MIEPTDEQLLEEYNKEIHGQYAYLAKKGEMTVARLIQSHRDLREWNKKWNKEYLDAQKEGYDYGYKLGMERVEENTITLDELRKMTIQELANFIGTDDD